MEQMPSTPDSGPFGRQCSPSLCTARFFRTTFAEPAHHAEMKIGLVVDSGR